MSGGGDETVGLVERDALFGEHPPPRSGLLTFVGPDRCDTHGAEEPTNGLLLTASEAAPDLLDRNCTGPGLDSAPSEFGETTSGGASAERVDDHR